MLYSGFFFHSVFHLQKLDIKEQSEPRVRKRKGKNSETRKWAIDSEESYKAGSLELTKTVAPNHTNTWFSSFGPCSPASSPAEEFVAGC